MWFQNSDRSQTINNDFWTVPERFSIPTFGYLDMPLPQHYWGIQDDIGRFREDSVRIPFIRKVYATLTCQLLITTGLMALFLYLPLFNTWAKEPNGYIIPVVAVSTSLCLLAMAFKDTVRRQAPANLVFLVIFTLVESLLLGVLSSIYDTRAMFMGMGLIAAVCLVWTLFACEQCCGIFWCITIVPSMSYSIYWTLLLQQDREQLSALVWASVVAFLVSCFFIFDIWRMTSDNEYSVSPHEYIFAALNILWDTITLVIVVPALIIMIILCSIIRLVVLCKNKESESMTNRQQ